MRHATPFLLKFLTVVLFLTGTTLTSCFLANEVQRPYAPKQYRHANKKPRASGSRKPDFTTGRRFR